jgi:hypothetical protein
MHETRARFREYLIGQQRGQSMPQSTGKSSGKAGEKQKLEFRIQESEEKKNRGKAFSVFPPVLSFL